MYFCFSRLELHEMKFFAKFISFISFVGHLTGNKYFELNAAHAYICIYLSVEFIATSIWLLRRERRYRCFWRFKMVANSLIQFVFRHYKWFVSDEYVCDICHYMKSLLTLKYLYRVL